MHSLYIVLLLACLASRSTQQGRQIDPEIERKINEYIHNVYLPEANVTTLGLTIVQNDGETLYTNGYGWANEEKQIPNTNDTQFIIASISKSFTAVVLIKTLHERFPSLGEAVLDTPIRQLIPEFNFTLIDRFRSEHGTIRDLLGHRMCLPRTDWIYYADAIESVAEVTYRQRYNEEVCDIRADFQYQNQIYTLAGEILSHLTGKSFEETVEEFLKELGMENSRFVRRTDDFANTPGIARPYYIDVNDGLLKPTNPELLLAWTGMNPAGGLLASPNEMATYLRFHMNLGKLDGKQIVPEEVIMWMRKPAIFTPATFGSFACGQGLFMSRYREWEYLQHSGGAHPFTSLMSLFTTHNLSVFACSNTGRIQTDVSALHAFILETLNGADDAADQARIVMNEWKLKEEKKKKDMEKAMEKFLKEQASRLGKRAGREEEPLGNYGNGAAGELEIVRKQNEFGQSQLYMMYGKHGTGWLGPVWPGVNLYLIDFDSDLMQHFFGATGKFWLVGDLEAVEIYWMDNDLAAAVSYGVFKAGVSLDKLPPIPWLPDSCPAQSE